MFKAKQKFTSILVACLMMIVSLIMAVSTLVVSPQTASAATSYVETSFGEGTFLITTTRNGTTYYLPATATSSAPVAKSFTDVNEIDDSNLWTVTANGSSYYIQNAEGNYLYTTSANNGVRVGTTKGTWEYNSKDNSLKYTSTSRFLGIYNGQDWRSYNSVTASNYKNTDNKYNSQLLKFYKVDSGSGEGSCAHETTAMVQIEGTNTHIKTCQNADCGKAIGEAINCVFNEETNTCECGNVALTYTLNYSAPNGVTIGEAPATVVGTNPVALPEVTFNNENYTFEGWTTETIADSSKKPTCYVGEYTVQSQDVKEGNVINFVAVFSKAEGMTTKAVYEKVTTEPADWSGTYLIVYEDGKVAFNGGLTTLDAVSNTVSVTISDGKIEGTDAMKAAQFAIAKSGENYTIQSASGKYIGRTADGNDIDESTSTQYTNKISLNEDGSTQIVGSGKAVLRYNATSGQDRFRYFKSSSYTSQKAICLYMAKEESTVATVYVTEFAAEECAHENTTTATVDATCTGTGLKTVTCDDCGITTYTEILEATGHVNTTTTTVDATCTEDGSITVTCNDCETTVSTEEIPATGHQNKTTTTVDATCTEDGSITVTCDDCGATVSSETIEAKGHSIEDSEPVNNQNGTHSITGTCTVCGEEDGTETVDCTFVRAENEPKYTCTECGYSYTVDEYTISFIVPEGVEDVESVKGEEDKTIVLPEAKTRDGYTFVGWTSNPYEAEQAPEFLEAGTEYTVTEEVEFYALYSCAVGADAWTMVTDVADLAVGKQIVIVASEYDYAMGASSSNGNNRTQVKITKSDDTVTIGNDVQIITLEAGTVANTFAFNVGNGYLYAASSGSNYLKTETTLSANSSWAITIAADGTATVVAQGTNTRNIMRYNKTSTLFSCYASGQEAICIYMLDSTTYYTTKLAHIDSASITLGSDLTMNYYVTMSDTFADAEMTFTVDGVEKTETVKGTKVDGRYVFSLNIPPQYMANNISAELKFGEEVIASMAEYSVKTYAQNQLNNNPSDELKQLLTDLLYYGNAAYNYVNETTGDTVIAGVENLGSVDETRKPEKNWTITTAQNPVWFSVAGVHFNNVNQLYLKLKTQEDVTLENVILKISCGGEVVKEVAVTGAMTVYTDAILATNFAMTYTFELFVGEMRIQTLTYSVNDYAYEMQNDGTMSALALALYRYGKSAYDYKYPVTE